MLRVTTEQSVPVIGEGLYDLLVRVHDKRSLPDHRLVQGIRCHQQQLGVVAHSTHDNPVSICQKGHLSTTLKSVCARTRRANMCARGRMCRCVIISAPWQGNT